MNKLFGMLCIAVLLTEGISVGASGVSGAVVSVGASGTVGTNRAVGASGVRGPVGTNQLSEDVLRDCLLRLQARTLYTLSSDTEQIKNQKEEVVPPVMPAVSFNYYIIPQSGNFAPVYHYNKSHSNRVSDNSEEYSLPEESLWYSDK